MNNPARESHLRTVFTLEGQGPWAHWAQLGLGPIWANWFHLVSLGGGLKNKCPSQAQRNTVNACMCVCVVRFTPGSRCTWACSCSSLLANPYMGLLMMPMACYMCGGSSIDEILEPATYKFISPTWAYLHPWPPPWALEITVTVCPWCEDEGIHLRCYRQIKEDLQQNRLDNLKFRAVQMGTDF